MSDQPDRGFSRTAWCVFAALAFIYVYFFQHYERIPNPNEQTRLYLTVAISERAEIGIDREIARFGDTLDVAEYGGRRLCDKAPGLSFIGVPFYKAYRAASRLFGHEPAFYEILKLLRVTSVALPSLLLIMLLFWGLSMVEPDERVRLAVIIVFALGTTAHTYSVLLFSHQVAGAMGAAAFVLAMKLRRGGSIWLAPPAGFLAGYAVLSEYPLLITAAITGIYLLATTWRRHGAIVLFVLGAAVPAAILLAYNKAAFGGWFSLGYGHIANQYYAQFHQQGALGVTTPKLDAFVGSFFSSSRGYFPFQPWLVLAFPGLWLLYGRRGLRAEAVAVTAAIIGFAYFISSFSYWQGGGTVSQRHLTALTPWLLIPITAFTAHAIRSRSAACQWLCAALGLFSIFAITASTVPFPFFSTQYPNPLYELALRLWRLGLIPYSIGRNAGLPGMWAAVPYLLAVAALGVAYLRYTVPQQEGFGSWRRRFVSLMAIASVCLAVAAYSHVARYNNIEGKTHDLWGIIGNYEPRDADCSDSRCLAIFGRTAEALEAYRAGR
ncbi:MAG: hypothetical protein WC889_14950 [Myxococcota bacterium]|jgi:hypothetical protein